jgi:transcriptional regulator with XRE-family HTH domain
MPAGASPIYRIEVGSAIAAARQAKGLSQQALARQIKVSSNSVSEWERGRSTPGLEPLRRLCEALDVPPETLLAMPPRPSDPARGDLIESLIKRVARANREVLPDLITLLREAEAEARELRARLRV